jgi:mRNA interferase RelE/StbE
LTYQIVILPNALKMLSAIPDQRLQKAIIRRIDGLASEPEKQGKPLIGPLLGYRSLRTVGQRYRIIYRVDEGKVSVLVVALGIREEGDKKDIYALAKRLVRLHLLEITQIKK